MSRVINLTGCRFNRLVVAKRVENDKDGCTRWLCKCDCGNSCIVSGKCLRNGHTQSCGYLNKEVNSKRSFIDRRGEKFGLLTVLSRAEDYIAPCGNKHVQWLCQCECGNTTIVDVNQLTSGKTKSCGCLSKGNNIKHGGRKDRLYGVFANMKNRCYNKNSEDYKY